MELIQGMFWITVVMMVFGFISTISCHDDSMTEMNVADYFVENGHFPVGNTFLDVHTIRKVSNNPIKYLKMYVDLLAKNNHKQTKGGLSHG